jgi:hypothetical protein
MATEDEMLEMEDTEHNIIIEKMLDNISRETNQEAYDEANPDK